MLIVFALLIVIIILFSLDRFPPDSIILISLIALVLAKVITPAQAFAGFGSDFIIMLSSIFIISASLQHNGVVEYLSNKLTSNTTNNYFLTIVTIMLSVGVLSAFMNNTTVAAVMVLPILGMCKKSGQSPSLYLMPMAFASLLGGTCTLIGTSTNIAGSNFLLESGIEPISMFEFLPIGAVLLIVCTLFFALLGKRILPNIPSSHSSTVKYNRLFYAHISVTEKSSLVGKSILSLNDTDLTFTKVENEEQSFEVNSDYTIQRNDNLYLNATSEALKLFYHTHNISETASPLETYKSEIVELMVLPSSFIANNTINESNFRHKTGLIPIGLFRKGENISSNILDIKIHTGDIVIAEGVQEEIEGIRQRNNFIVLTQLQKSSLPHLKKGFIALAIFALAVIVGATGLMPMSISFLSAVLLAMSFKVLPADVVYSKVDWRLIILIGGMTAFGTAIKQTGGDIFLAQQITTIFSGANHIFILLAFMILTVLLTQPMSNAAAALVILPIALQTANSIGADPRSFAIAIILSASISMITPFEPASLLVLGPGRYKISHFFKIGGVLTIVGLLIILLMINLFYKI